MSVPTPASSHLPTLATDLDGTLIPLPHQQDNAAALQVLARQHEQNQLSLVYVTGRHLESVLSAIDQFGLPVPDWIICDVGTSIYQRRDKRQFALLGAYHDFQAQIVAGLPLEDLRQLLAPIPGLRLQESEKQGRFKLSFYTNAELLEQLTTEIEQTLQRAAAPYSIIHSVDPFTGGGLIDLLPLDVSKAHALEWWVTHQARGPDSLVFAGDSGNDWAAFQAGYRSILVGNAARSLARRIYQTFREKRWEHRLYLAKGHATTGVLEGCRWFGLSEA